MRPMEMPRRIDRRCAGGPAWRSALDAVRGRQAGRRAPRPRTAPAARRPPNLMMSPPPPRDADHGVEAGIEQVGQLLGTAPAHGGQLLVKRVNPEMWPTRVSRIPGAPSPRVGRRSICRRTRHIDHRTRPRRHGRKARQARSVRLPPVHHCSVTAHYFERELSACVTGSPVTDTFSTWPPRWVRRPHRVGVHLEARGPNPRVAEAPAPAPRDVDIRDVRTCSTPRRSLRCSCTASWTTARRPRALHRRDDVENLYVPRRRR